MNDPVVAFALLVLALAAVFSAPWWSHRLILTSKPPSVTIFVDESTTWNVLFSEKKRFTLQSTPTRGTLEFELPGQGISVTDLPEGALTTEGSAGGGATVTASTSGELNLKVTGVSVGGPYTCKVQAIGSTGHPVTDARVLNVIVIETVPPGLTSSG